MTIGDSLTLPPPVHWIMFCYTSTKSTAKYCSSGYGCCILTDYQTNIKTALCIPGPDFELNTLNAVMIGGFATAVSCLIIHVA